MSDARNRCDPALMDRFFDGEADEAEGVRARAHVAQCPQCRLFLERNRAIGGLLRSDPGAVLTRSEREALEERVIARAVQRRPRPWAGLKGILSPRRLIPLAAAAGMLVFAFIQVFETVTPAGPSAIVTSFQGDYASVMIMEAPESRSTIIWFVETT